MTQQNQNIMKFGRADSWVSVTLSALLILGSIAGLIIWSLQSAYTFK